MKERDEAARTGGFKDWNEVTELINKVDLTSIQKIRAFYNWRDHDGTKAGLLALGQAEPKEGQSRMTDPDWVTKLLDKGEHFAIIAMQTRLGARLFSICLEHRHFPPTTELNKEFQFALSNWQQIPWYIIVLKNEYRPLVDALLKEMNMHLANGTPRMCTSAGWASFPVEHSRAFTLENGPGCCTYANDARLNITASQAEDAAIDREIALCHQKHGIKEPER